VSSKKKEIQAQSEELAESYQTISQVNESLEERIQKRTSELQQAIVNWIPFLPVLARFSTAPHYIHGLAEVAKITIKDESAWSYFAKWMNGKNLDKMLVKLQSISDVGSQELIFKEVLLREIFENGVDQLART